MGTRGSSRGRFVAMRQLMVDLANHTKLLVGTAVESVS